MPVTLKDVAQKAGVSPTTVSFVLNQSRHSRISAATRQKVLDAVRELGYQSTKTSNPALGISQNIPPTIGFVITDVGNPFFTKLSSVVEDVASRFGYNIILCNTKKDLKKEQEYLKVLWRRQIDGLIIAPVDDTQSNLNDFLTDNIPVVFVDRYIEGIHASAVLLDNFDGSYNAIEYLIHLGHKRIGIIAGRQSVTTGKERLSGYLQALNDHGIEIDEALIYDSQYSFEGGQQAIQALLNLSAPPSAIFSSGGVPTVGALLELKQQGIHIPGEISFIGFDDEQWMQLIEPPLTVVAQPVTAIGTEAAQLVIQLIQGWGKGEKRKIVLKSELIIRESCQKLSR